MKRLVPFLAALLALAVFAAFALAGPTALESARKTKTAADAGVVSAESTLARARATDVAAAETVTALEGVEPPPKEEPPTSSTVNASPTGPAGSWSVAFADGFGKPVGSTGDTFWHAHSTSEHPAGWKGCCNNSTETATENPSAVHWGEATGLELRCEGLVCSGVSTTGFTYQLGRGASFAVEVVAKLPDNTLGGEDPGAWSCSANKCVPEFDWFEYWGWGCTTNCVGGFPVYKSNGLGSHELYVRLSETLGAEPWAAFHRYTTVVEGSKFTEYIDGKLMGSFTQAVNTDAMDGILTHALRVSTAPRNTSFDVRSVAIYEDTAHAGQFISGGGVAPGTVVR
jgi:hypothetical protein